MIAHALSMMFRSSGVGVAFARIRSTSSMNAGSFDTFRAYGRLYPAIVAASSTVFPSAMAIAIMRFLFVIVIKCFEGYVLMVSEKPYLIDDLQMPV